MESKSENPILIEPGVRYFLNATLNKCNNLKNKYYNTVFNISVTLGLVFIISIILYSRYKGRLTKEEIYIKEKQKEQYIMSKIKNYQDTRRKEKQQMITNLPKW